MRQLNFAMLVHSQVPNNRFDMGFVAIRVIE